MSTKQAVIGGSHDDEQPDPSSFSDSANFFDASDTACQRRAYHVTVPPLGSLGGFGRHDLATHAAHSTNPCGLPANWIVSGDPDAALELAIRRGVDNLNSKVPDSAPIVTSSSKVGAAPFNAPDCIDRISEICSDDGILSTAGATALGIALVRGRWAFAQTLLRAGASVVQCTCSEFGLTAHHLVCASGNVAIVEEFVKIAGLANFFAARSEVGNLSPMHVAAALGRMDVIDWAVEAFAAEEESGKPILDPATGAKVPHPASVASADGEYPAHFLARWRFIPGGDTLMCSTSLSLPRADVTTDTLCDLLRFARPIADDDDGLLPMWWLNLRPCVNARNEHVLHLCHPFVASELIETLVPAHGHASSANLRADSDERSAVSRAIVDALFDDLNADGDNSIVSALRRKEGEFVGVALKLLPGDELRPRLVADRVASGGTLLHLAVAENQPDATRHLVNVAGQEAAGSVPHAYSTPTFAGDDTTSSGFGSTLPSCERQEAWCRGAFSFAAAADVEGNTPLHVAARNHEDSSAAASAIIEPLVRGVTRLAAESSRSPADGAVAKRVRDLARKLLWGTPNASGMTPLHDCVTGEHGADVATSILQGAASIEASLEMLAPNGPATFSPPAMGGGGPPPAADDCDPPEHISSTPASPVLDSRQALPASSFLDAAGPPRGVEKTAEKRRSASPTRTSAAADDDDADADDDSQPVPMPVEAVAGTHGSFDMNAMQFACSQGRGSVVRAMVKALAAHGGPMCWMAWCRSATGDTCAHLAALTGDDATLLALVHAVKTVPPMMRVSFLARRNRAGQTAGDAWRASYKGRDPSLLQCIAALES